MFRVWYAPQLTGPSFEIEVEDFLEACRLLDTLYNFSLFEFENKLKPDYADLGGIQEWDGEWLDVDFDELQYSVGYRERKLNPPGKRYKKWEDHRELIERVLN
jgi:hypothetical protein